MISMNSIIRYKTNVIRAGLSERMQASDQPDLSSDRSIHNAVALFMRVRPVRICLKLRPTVSTSTGETENQLQKIY